LGVEIRGRSFVLNDRQLKKLGLDSLIKKLNRQSRKAWKKGTGGTKAPAEFSSFCRHVFLNLTYENTALEAAMERAVKEASGEARAALREYLLYVRENEHDPDSLQRAWEEAAREGGYWVEGDARDFFLMAGKLLKKSRPRERRARRHG
jgi:hypothetical protein